MENVRVYKNLNRTIARHVDTQAALEAVQAERAARAEARLAQHRKTGTHRVTTSRGQVDRFVSLEGPAALSLDVGFHHARSGEWVEGIHAISEDGE